MSKKNLFGMLTCVVIVGIFYLTLQAPDETICLSNTVSEWLKKLGLHTDSHALRSNAHLVEYFLLGIVLTLLGRSMGWKTWRAIAIGCACGVVDECLRIFLPTREFDGGDLLKDFVGIAVAATITLIVLGSRKRATQKTQCDSRAST